MLLLQQLVNGLLVGALYALFAAGLSLSMGVLRVLNMAHGVTLTLVAILGVELARDGLESLPLLLLVGAAAGAGIGAGLELLAFRPLRRPGQDGHWASLISSLACLLVLQSVAQMVTDTQFLRFPEVVFRSRPIELLGISVRSITLVVAVTGVLLVVGSWLILRFTHTGRVVRAVAARPEAAEMLGIRSNAYSLGTMAASGAMAGVAGILVGVAFSSVHFLMGDSLLLRGFVVVVLGGIGSVMGALAGGLTLGLVEGLTIHYVGSAWRDAAAFGLLMIIMIVRPYGLLGKPGVDRA